MLAVPKQTRLQNNSLQSLLYFPMKIKPPPFAGAFGFVVLAEEIGTEEKWAIKFLERGNKITKVRFEVFSVQFPQFASLSPAAAGRFFFFC